MSLVLVGASSFRESAWRKTRKTEKRVTNYRKLSLDYIKGHLFPVVHADGVIGGGTLRGNFARSASSTRSKVATTTGTLLSNIAKGNRTSKVEKPKSCLLRANIAAALVSAFGEIVQLDTIFS